MTYADEAPPLHASHTPPPSPKLPLTPPIKALLAVIREALASGEGVLLQGLGSFTVAQHAARTGRNPRTGEIIPIPSSKRAHFKMAKGLRLLLNQ